MYTNQIPQVLVSPEFLAIFRQDHDPLAKHSKPDRRKHERFCAAMQTLLYDSINSWDESRSNPFFERTVAIPSKKTVALVGQRHTKQFLNVLDANGWRVDHSYSTGTESNRPFCKHLGIPMGAYEQVYEFLKEHEPIIEANGSSVVKTSWEQPAIAEKRKDGSARYHSFQLPSAVRVNVQQLMKHVKQEEADGNQNIFGKLKARTLLTLAVEHDGWINQYYQEALSGRVYGQGIGNLALADKKLLVAMLAGCWQLDMQAAGQTLFPQVCRKIMNDENLMFDGLKEYAGNRKCLRNQWARVVFPEMEVSDENQEKIKKAVTALLYGCSVASKKCFRDGSWKVPALLEELGSEEAVRRFRGIEGVQAMEKDIRRGFKMVINGLQQSQVLKEYGLDRKWMDQARASEVVSYVIQRTESRILAAMLEELGNQVILSKHDAVVVLDWLDQVDTLEDQVLKKTGYRIRLDQEVVSGA